MNILHLTIEGPNGDKETLTIHRHNGYTKRDLAEMILERHLLLPNSDKKVWDGNWSEEDPNDLTIEEIAFVLDIDDVATYVNDEYSANLRMNEFLPEPCNRDIEKALRTLAETVGLTFEVL